MKKSAFYLAISAGIVCFLSLLGYEGWKIHNDQMALLALRNEHVAVRYGRNGILGALGIYKYVGEVTFVLPPTSREAVSELARAPHLEYVGCHRGIDFTPFHAEIATLQAKGVIIRPEMKW